MPRKKIWKDVDEYGQYTIDSWFSSKPENNKRTCYPHTESFIRSLAIMSLGLAGETGEVIEKLKKYIRDGDLDRDLLKKELGDVAFYWARISREFGFKPSEVLTANVEKLDSRRARGTMRGSGDNR